MGMHTVVLGAGALGSIIAGHLARAGERVTLVARGQRAEFLTSKGITITGLESFHVPVKIAHSIGDVPDADVIILATKTYDTNTVLTGAGLSKSPVAFSVQNGVQKNAELASVFGERQVLGAAANMSGEILADGRAAFTLHASLPIGELDGSISSRAEEIAGMLARAGIRSKAVSEIRSVEWTKYAAYSALMAPAVLCRAPSFTFTSDIDASFVVAQIVREIGRLAAREGVGLLDDGPLPAATICRLSLGDAAAAVRKIGDTLKATAPNHRISALQDLERGRRMEHDATLGFAVRRAIELGMELQVIETCYRMIAMLDRRQPVAHGL